MVTAGIDMRDFSVFVGSDSSAVRANTLVAVRPSPAAAAAARRCLVVAPRLLLRRRCCCTACASTCPHPWRAPRPTALQSGLSMAAGQQLSVPANGTQGRYVIVYGGNTSEVGTEAGRGE